MSVCASSRPGDVALWRTITASFQRHSNGERPNQALSCGNQPPCVAFPTLPARPSVPLLIDPDALVQDRDGRHVVRKVQQCGLIRSDHERSYLPAE
jgi:hypothetical protein